MDMEAVINNKLAQDITPANQGQFSLSIAGVASDAMRFLSVQSAGHAISDNYHFKFHIELQDYLAIDTLIGKPACFEILDAVIPQYVHGVITQVTYAGKRVDGESYHISLHSPLYPFSQNMQNRVFLNKNVAQIIEDVLSAGGLSGADYQIKLRGDYVTREFTIQYAESDFAFLTRQLAHEGLFYVFEQSDQGAKLLVLDTLEDIPTFALGDIRFQLQSGTARAMQTVYELNRYAGLLTDSVHLKDYNYRTPEATLETLAGRNSGVSGAGTAYRYGENFKSLDEGDRLAHLRQQALDWQREVYIADSNCRGLGPGMKFSLTDHPNAELNGDYVVIAIDHKADQSAAQARGGNSREPTYANQLTLIRAGIPFRRPVPAHRYMNGVFTAKVETTGGDYAYLDEQGRYRIRMPFDLAGTAAGEASHPVRQAQSYSGADYGMHFPLHAGTEVVITCVNGDMDRPILLGALHNPDAPNLVTSGNNSQNILRSWADNELFMEDRQGEERIELFTREKKNQLSLDAKQSGHKIYLATEEGEMEQYAAKTMLIESGDTQTVQSGKDHILTVENRQYLTTKNKQIEFKAATDIRQKAGNNVQITAETENIEMRVGKDMVVDVQDNMSLEVRNQDLNIIVSNGNFEIKAAKAITVNGQGGGNINISQAGGSVVIDTGGAITIAGTSVSIDGNAVYLKGATVGQGGGGSGSGASGSHSASNVANLNLAALDLFSHVAQQAQAVAASLNTTVAASAEKSVDLTTAQLQMQSSSNSYVTNTTGLITKDLPNASTQHYVEFEYKDENGDGVNDVRFVVNFDDGSKMTGTIDGGFGRLDGVPNKGFNIEFAPGEALKAELVTLRKSLRQELDASLAQVKKETAMLNKTWEETAAWKKPLIYAGGAFVGIGQWVGDNVDGVVNIVTGAIKADILTVSWLAEYVAHRGKAFNAFASGDDAGFKREMQAIEGMHQQLGEDISSVAASVKTLTLIAWDDETRQMLTDFPKAYFSELATPEKVRTGFRYGIDFLLVVTTGPVGEGLLAIKNAEKISGIISRMAKIIEKLRLNLKAREVKVDDTYRYKVRNKGAVSQNEIGQVNAGKIKEPVSDEVELKKSRLPRNNGKWDGEPGESNWYSNLDEANEITGGEPIPFKNRRPDFSKWSKGEVTFEKGILKGTDDDFSLVYEEIAKSKGLKNKTAAKKVLSEKGLTPHHLNDTTIQLIPTKLHGNIPHIGSASDLRGK